MQADFQTHTALALVILKSKPSGIAVEEYVMALRGSLLPLNGTSCNQTSIFDTTALWHRLFCKSQRSNLHLQAELAAGQVNNEACTDETGEKPAAGKRQRGGQKANTQSKRRKIDSTALFNVDPEPPEVEPLHKAQQLLLRTMVGLARQADGIPTRPDNLTHLICLACEAMTEGLNTCRSNTLEVSSDSRHAPTLHQVCRAIRIIWSGILQNLVDTQTIDKAVVIPQLMSVVHLLITILDTFCVHEAEAMHEESTTQYRAKRRKGSSSTVLEDRDQRQALFENNCEILAAAISHILSSSHVLQEGYQEIFDAVTATFLQHLGSTMSMALFGHSLDLSGIAKAESLTAVDPLEMVALGAPYLVTAVQGLMHHQAKSNMHTSAYSKQQIQRLQQQLVRGIFGHDKHIGIVSDAGPNIVMGDLQPAEQQEKPEIFGPAETLIAEVWEFLGWDILFPPDGEESHLKSH